MGFLHVLTAGPALELSFVSFQGEPGGGDHVQAFRAADRFSQVLVGLGHAYLVPSEHHRLSEAEGRIFRGYKAVFICFLAFIFQMAFQDITGDAAVRHHPLPFLVLFCPLARTGMIRDQAEPGSLRDLGGNEPPPAFSCPKRRFSFRVRHGVLFRRFHDEDSFYLSVREALQPHIGIFQDQVR